MFVMCAVFGPGEGLRTRYKGARERCKGALQRCKGVRERCKGALSRYKGARERSKGALQRYKMTLRALREGRMGVGSTRERRWIGEKSCAMVDVWCMCDKGRELGGEF